MQAHQALLKIFACQPAGACLHAPVLPLGGNMTIRKSIFASLLPAALLLGAATASAQSVIFQGQTFVNNGLVGVARVPSNAVDKYGDTVSLASGMTTLPGSGHKRGDGGYIGRFLMLP